jgi:hypothetical protein
MKHSHLSIAILSFAILLFGCKLEESPDENQFFQEVIDINGADVSPLLTVQRPDGKIHVMFVQGGIYGSVLLSKALEVDKIQMYPSLGNLNWQDSDITGDGGFVFITSNRVLKISPNQIIEFDKNMAFSPAIGHITSFKGVEVTPSNIYITGNSKLISPSVSYMGYLKLSLSGEQIDSKIFNSANDVAKLDDYTPYGITSLSNSQYATIGYFNTNFTTIQPNSFNLITKKLTGFPYAVYSIGNKILVASVNDLLDLKSIYFLKLTHEGELERELELPITDINNSSQKILISKDGNEFVQIQAISKDSVLFSGYDFNTFSTTPVFSKRLGRTGGKVYAQSISITQSGYVITGSFTNALNQNLLYLIKTDTRGNSK